MNTKYSYSYASPHRFITPCMHVGGKLAEMTNIQEISEVYIEKAVTYTYATLIGN